MPSVELTIDGRRIEPRKAIFEPQFKEKPVHVSDTFDYVDMWLRNSKFKDVSKSYWQQARDFYFASKQINTLSQPLTAYYCALNLTKSLLRVKIQNYNPSSERHGVTGHSTGNRSTISNEIVEIKSSGVLAELARFYGDAPDGVHNLSDIFYNIPYIHRVYCLCLASRNTELYLPIKEMHFRKVTESREVYLSGTFTKNWANSNTLGKLPPRFENDPIENQPFQIRYKRRFRVSGRITSDANIDKGLT